MTSIINQDNDCVNDYADDPEKSFDELKLLGKYSDSFHIVFIEIHFYCVYINRSITCTTSTPVKRRSSCKHSLFEENTFPESSELTKKHELTPESRASGLPARKRNAIGKNLHEIVIEICLE